METTLSFRSYDGTPLEGTFRGNSPSSAGVVVLVHGITSSRDEFGLFSGLAQHLADVGVPSLRFDYRSHGQSKLPVEAMTLAGIVNDIESAAALALMHSCARFAYVVGMSFGGGLSAYWAATTKIAVESVVMFAPVIDYEQDVLGQHGALLNGKLADDAAQLLERQGYLEMDGVRYGRALLNELRFISGAEGLRRLKCRSLIVHGDADSIVPFASSQRFAQMHDHCTLVNVPGTDHGFGVGDDEDLSSPDTKQKQREVFGIVSRFLQGTTRA